MSLMLAQGLGRTIKGRNKKGGGGDSAVPPPLGGGLAVPDTVPELRLGGGGISKQQLAYDRDEHLRWQHLYVLPVLLLEFLAIALTRAVLPALLLQQYGNGVYLVLGCADCVRGLLAFVACPLFGKISDVIGRRICLFVTVLGTCAPVCCLAFFSWDEPNSSLMTSEATAAAGVEAGSGLNDTTVVSIAANEPEETSESLPAGMLNAISLESSAELQESGVHPYAIAVFVVLLALSGIFSSTFTLVFAYISDTVRQQDERVSAYGLALATFGLSFTIGPMAGGYLAPTNKQYVFLCSLFLTILDLLYIYLILPESRKLADTVTDCGGGNNSASSVAGTMSVMTLDHNFSWNPWDTIRIVIVDPFLRLVGQVAFLYYTGLWAVISTLSVYAVKRFHLSPERLGELMSILGLCTMVAEAVLVRIMVPMLGEKTAMKVGLVAFGLQCVVLGFAYEGWHLFVCAAFSLLGNLVYPSLSSLVSGSVEPDAVGEALGAVNGIKALTEGIGPLFFGSLMTISERSALPGWPYLLAALLSVGAYKCAEGLPDVEDDDYIHELDKLHSSKKKKKESDSDSSGMFQSILGSVVPGYNDNDDDDDDNDSNQEHENLISEVDEEDEDDIYPKSSNEGDEDKSRLPTTFAHLLKDKDSSPPGSGGATTDL